jgi:GTP cyclohydrolase I
VAEALSRHLGARGAACLLEAEHLCLSVRGERRPRALAHAEAFTGELQRDGAPRRRLLALAGRAGAAARRSGSRWGRR